MVLKQHAQGIVPSVNSAFNSQRIQQTSIRYHVQCLLGNKYKNAICFNLDQATSTRNSLLSSRSPQHKCIKFSGNHGL